MKIHEYQAKEILKKLDVPVPRGVMCRTVEEAVQAAHSIGGVRWVVKAQIHAGGRGKGGGVKVASSPDEIRRHAEKILGMTLVTHQTGPGGRVVRRLLIEEAADIRKECYLGAVVDRAAQSVTIIASAEGGTDIEELAVRMPERIHKLPVDPAKGMGRADAEALAGRLGFAGDAQNQAAACVQSLYRAFWESDASLAEINPLILTGDGRVVALDAKIVFDDNALFRHPEYAELRDLDEEDPNEIEASKFGLNYIQLDGDIGCLVNGAGLAMATMDIIKLYGSSPANFLDVGGGATAEQVTEAFKIMLRNPHLKAILVNIFGGIMRCDVVAEGLVSAAKQVHLKVPLVARLEGTNVEQGRRILGESGIAIITATTMADAAEKVVAASRGA
jgi:succinyl-CoA synthetase beta subunit